MKLLFNLLTEAVDSSGGSDKATMDWPFFLICIGVVAILMFISSRQRKKQQEAANAKLNNIKVGDQVKTIGLIYGEIVEIDTEMETFVIKTGSESCPSYIKVDKMAIYQVIPPLSEVVPENTDNNQEQPKEEVFEQPSEDNGEAKTEENKE